jgi:hypothetical protein
MTKYAIYTVTLLLGAAALQAADSTTPAGFDAAASFRQLKSLAGDWQADTPMGKARLHYEVIGAGTAVVEHENMGDEPAMMSVYYMDNGRLMLTHYCMLGNQPRMQARAFDQATHELQFRFVDAGNLADPGDTHIHNVNLRFIDGQHLDAAWQVYEKGQLQKTETAQYKRIQ